MKKILMIGLILTLFLVSGCKEINGNVDLTREHYISNLESIEMCSSQNCVNIPFYLLEEATSNELRSSAYQHIFADGENIINRNVNLIFDVKHTNNKIKIYVYDYGIADRKIGMC